MNKRSTNAPRFIINLLYLMIRKKNKQKNWLTSDKSAECFTYTEHTMKLIQHLIFTMTCKGKSIHIKILHQKPLKKGEKQNKKTPTFLAKNSSQRHFVGYRKSWVIIKWLQALRIPGVLQSMWPASLILTWRDATQAATTAITVRIMAKM